MSTSEFFKFDVRIRERMLNKGLISEKDVQAHLEALQDLESETRSVSIAQPALAAPELDDEDDDEDDEDDDDEGPQSTELP